jgi:hypothetical protein
MSNVAYYLFLIITSPLWLGPVIVAYLLRLVGIKLI